jgi:tRNA dimethylallyltransferase
VFLRLGFFLKVLSLIGPTGVGKTDLSIVLARLLKAEILSVDSAQVYRGMDIGTGKPSPALRKEIPHHGLDLAEPEEEFDVLRYTQSVVPVLSSLVQKDRWVLLVGGAGLYFRVLRRGLCEAPGRDPIVRDRLLAEGQADGSEALHGRLSKVDPESASRIHPNDLKKVVRAVEVFELSGRPLSTWQKETVPWIQGLEHSPVFGITMERPVLFARLEQRTLRWLEGGGWLEEASRLHGRPLSQTARETLGYGELFEFLEGRADWVTTRGRIIKNTCRYAKRQWTWFRREPGVQWLEATRREPGEIAREIARQAAREG